MTVDETPQSLSTATEQSAPPLPWVQPQVPPRTMFGPSRRWRGPRMSGADFAVIISVVLVVVGTVLLEGRKGPAVVHPAKVITAQERADAVAVRSGCPARVTTGVDAALRATPTVVLTYDTLYAARIATTAGTFTVVLYTGGAATVTNDFVYLAERQFFHCVPISPVTPEGSITAGNPGPAAGDASGAGSLHNQVAVGTLVASAGGSAITGAGRWYVVTGRQGTRVGLHDVVFGRVTAGMGVVEKIAAAGSARAAPARAIYRILSVTVVPFRGSG